jgi:hypothetical protein
MNHFLTRAILMICTAVLAITMDAKAYDDLSATAKQQHQLLIKVDREMRGAEVTIYYSDQRNLLKEAVRKRKLLIDFETASVGSYIITVQKGDSIQTYHYVKI